MGPPQLLPGPLVCGRGFNGARDREPHYHVSTEGEHSPGGVDKHTHKARGGGVNCSLTKQMFVSFLALFWSHMNETRLKLPVRLMLL